MIKLLIINTSGLHRSATGDARGYRLELDQRGFTMELYMPKYANGITVQTDLDLHSLPRASKGLIILSLSVEFVS